MQISEIEERKKEQKKYLKSNSWIFSKINDRYQITYPRSSENIKQDKYPEIVRRRMSYSNGRNQRKKENIVRSQREKIPYL